MVFCVRNCVILLICVAGRVAGSTRNSRPFVCNVTLAVVSEPTFTLEMALSPANSIVYLLHSPRSSPLALQCLSLLLSVWTRVAGRGALFAGYLTIIFIYMGIHWFVYLSDFLKTNLTKFSVICVKKRQNSRFLKVTRPSFFGGVPSYIEALWYPYLYFYRKSNT